MQQSSSDCSCSTVERRKIYLVGIDRSFLSLIKKNVERNIPACCHIFTKEKLPKGFDCEGVDLFLFDTRGSKARLSQLIIRVRQKCGVKTKILILGNQEEIDLKLRLFNLGIDEFLNKPFDFRELNCRIKRLLDIYFADGRMNASSIKVIDSIFLDMANYLLYVDGVRIKLSYVECLIVKFLSEKRFIVDKETLLDSLSIKMGLEEMTENYFNVILCRLRKKIYQQSGRKLIQTRYGKGIELMV